MIIYILKFSLNNIKDTFILNYNFLNNKSIMNIKIKQKVIHFNLK